MYPATTHIASGLIGVSKLTMVLLKSQKGLGKVELRGGGDWILVKPAP
jgi:hypothetical protein